MKIYMLCIIFYPWCCHIWCSVVLLKEFCSSVLIFFSQVPIEQQELCVDGLQLAGRHGYLRFPWTSLCDICWVSRQSSSDCRWSGGETRLCCDQRDEWLCLHSTDYWAGVWQHSWRQEGHIYGAIFSTGCTGVRSQAHLQVSEISGLILGLCPANERRRYKVTPVTPSLIGWAQT